MAQQQTHPTPPSCPLPPLPETDPLTKDQWRTLFAIADCIVPSIVPQSRAKGPNTLPMKDAAFASTRTLLADRMAAGEAESNAHDITSDYLAERPSDVPEFRAAVHRYVATCVPQDLKTQFTLGLNLLNYRITSMALTGRPVVFADQPVATREAIVRSWATARLPAIRLLFKSLTLLVKQNWIKCSPLPARMMGFPRVPVHGKPVRGFEFDFVQIPPGEEPQVLETDVVVVGSGCGGGVVAKRLAEAGHGVLVCDKGYHWPSEVFPMTETEGLSHMFFNGGGAFSEDNSTIVIAGQTWGGGGTVNWSASLQTQGYVREEWARGGLPFFTSAEYQDCLDTIEARMGVSDAHIDHNTTSSALLEGARRLGWAAKTVPQNTAGKEHHCGYCMMGCREGGKQGPATCFLPDAARAGAKFIEGFDVKKVLFAKDKHGGRSVAVGVEGTWVSRDGYGGLAGSARTTRRVVVKAKRVVVSAGTMHSPIVLMRSGIKNRQLGKNLKLHPVCLVGSIYDQETRPWEGPILSAVVTEMQNLDGAGHGPKLEACTMLPSTWMTWVPWRSGLDYKLLTPRMRNMTGHIALTRDKGSGEVYVDPRDGRCRFRYTPSKLDRQHMLAGVVALARINYAAGAREIFTTLATQPAFVRPAVAKPVAESDRSSSHPEGAMNDPVFAKWLDQLRRAGLPDPDTTFVSAHQMGSCRMAARRADGVVDPRGRVWGTEGLYVADASTFPSASGVNPMVTTMGIAEWVGRGVERDLRAKDNKGKL